MPLGDALFNAKTAAAAQAVNPLVFDGQKLFPSVTRVFSRSRDLYAYLQAYERDAQSMQPLVAYVVFFKGDERKFEAMPFVVSDGMDPKSKAVPLKLTIPLQSIADGEYVCQITVVDPTGQKVAFWQAPIKIVP